MEIFTSFCVHLAITHEGGRKILIRLSFRRVTSTGREIFEFQMFGRARFRFDKGVRWVRDRLSLGLWTHVMWGFFSLFPIWSKTVIGTKRCMCMGVGTLTKTGDPRLFFSGLSPINLLIDSFRLFPLLKYKRMESPGIFF